MGPESSTFTIVMDSPFGSLDEIYRRQVAKSIPKLANQLIILVTKTQWRGEVQEEVKVQKNVDNIKKAVTLEETSEQLSSKSQDLFNELFGDKK